MDLENKCNTKIAMKINILFSFKLFNWTVNLYFIYELYYEINDLSTIPFKVNIKITWVVK